jgi:membrane complex biogenesis BtpA family protein
VIRNDADAALGIAAAIGADFIRINVHVGAMLTDQGIIEGAADSTLRRRAALAPGVLIFADHLVKHAAVLAAVDEAQSAHDLRERGLADAVIVTGSGTGKPADPDRLRWLRDLLDAPLIIGSGLSTANASAFAAADAAIVGTAMKAGGQVDREVDPARVAAIVAAFKFRSS